MTGGDSFLGIFDRGVIKMGCHPFLRHRSTRSAKLPFFQKAAAVVVIAEFARIQDYEERRERTYAGDELTIRANAPSPLLFKSSVQKVRA